MRLAVCLPLALLVLFGCRADEKEWEEIVDELDQDDDGSRSDLGDCDDDDPTVSPDQPEVCDGKDNDCDGEVDDGVTSTWYADADADGYGDAATPLVGCEAPAGATTDATDCDDAQAAVHPGADEADCTDPVDYNCDGQVGYADGDGDGVPACEDCDDAAATTFPGAAETCNDADDDCDGVVDDGAADASTWYGDGDGDGWGTDAETAEGCDAPEGFVAETGDCDDADAAWHPGAAEDDCADPNDYNCDGAVGYVDGDGDGLAACEECDDADADVFPGALEVCNGIDDDCDGTADEPDAAGAGSWYADADGDGFGDADTAVTACDAPAGYVADASDCDDRASGTFPGAEELCNALDDDCDGAVDESGATGESTWYADSDGDGYGHPDSGNLACDAPAGTVADGTDCDDGAAGVHPGATETCNGEDDDCDGAVDEAGASGEGTWYADADGDGFGAGAGVTACDAPAGYVADGTDCDDAAASTNPDAVESCNSRDDDCDGATDEAGSSGESTWYADTDGDGYGDAAASATGCTAPSGHVADDADCDDASAAIHPGAAEVCDAADNDCTGDADDGGLCPCDVEYYGGDPYMFCESALAWSAADTTCASYGYELVAIADSAENVWVVGEAYGRYTGKWWTGLNDADSEGTWAWTTGESVTYTNWASGEPNNSGNEDCMQLGRYLDYTWNDEPCTSAFRYVCEG